MELLNEEIHNLRISPREDDYIYRFSKLQLDNLELQSNKKIIVGFHIFKTTPLPINNYDKKYYITVTDYLTEKKFKHIYPFNNTMDIATARSIKNPSKLFKEKYDLTKKEASSCKIFEVYNSKNVVIFGVNIPRIFKKLKNMKITKTLHMYSNPYCDKNIESIYSDIVSTKFSGLNKRFFFFYDNIKISLKEKHIMERII